MINEREEHIIKFAISKAISYLERKCKYLKLFAFQEYDNHKIYQVNKEIQRKQFVQSVMDYRLEHNIFCSDYALQKYNSLIEQGKLTNNFGKDK